MNAIEAHALTKRYGKRAVVDALDMHVAAGDIYGFVGKNGAGKSTTMKMASGLVAPSSGSLSVLGENAARRPGSFSGASSHIGALIEEPGALPNFSATENLMQKALALGVIHPREQVAELLALVGLEEAGTRKVKHFSQGMKQRLGLALALVGSPELLLLDEPFNGIDPQTTRDLRRTLVRLNQERAITIVISSHVLDQLMRVCTRFGLHDADQVVLELTVLERDIESYFVELMD